MAYLLAYGTAGGLSKHFQSWTNGKCSLITFDIGAWREAITANGLPILLKGSDEGNAPFKRTLIGTHARGRVLEIGAGTGMTLKYYDASKVTTVYAVEPVKELHPLLYRSIAELPKLDGKVRVVDTITEDVEAFERHGIRQGSIDTVCLVQVLCSVHDVQEHVDQLAKYVKKGGEILLFEHVASSDRFIAFVQRIFQAIWTPLAGNYHLTRDPVIFFRNEKGWRIEQYDRPAIEAGGGLFPHAIARIVKEF